MPLPLACQCSLGASTFHPCPPKMHATSSRLWFATPSRSALTSAPQWRALPLGLRVWQSRRSASRSYPCRVISTLLPAWFQVDALAEEVHPSRARCHCFDSCATAHGRQLLDRTRFGLSHRCNGCRLSSSCPLARHLD